MALPSTAATEPASSQQSQEPGAVLYESKCDIIIIGGAITCDLRDANLPGEVLNKHMTLLWDSSKKWDQNDIDLFVKFKEKWIETKYSNINNKKNTISFTISHWGPRSSKIHGDLYDFCLDCRETLKLNETKKQRIPHVALFLGQTQYQKPMHSNKIDSKITYHTCGTVYRIGKAVAISLTDVNLPGSKEIENKHMVLFWRPTQFNDMETFAITDCVNKWIENAKKIETISMTDASDEKYKISFNIETWGQCSVKVRGDLETLCLHVREKMGSICGHEQRIPHIKLFVKKYANNNRKRRMNDDDSKMDIDLDLSTVYRTNGNVKRIGRSVVIDLSDSKDLLGNTSGKHMVILFRSSPNWENNEIEMIKQTVNVWIKLNKLDSVSFSLDNWGKHSMKIKGELYDLCLDLRQIFHTLSKDKQRIPHVKLFK